MAYSLGITLSVVAWGWLVRAAIDFGTSAREGSASAWLFLALACVGAAACLFVGLILGTRLLRHLGIVTDPTPQPPPPGERPGRRIAS